MADMADLRDETLDRIEQAFAGTPRPPDAALLHERCFDDNDIVALYGVPHWRELPDETVEQEYAALSFLSPAGYRHFIPAYMRFALRNLGTGAAAVDSTIWSFDPDRHDDPALRDFARSKLEPLEAGERAAVGAFLQAVRTLGDPAETADAERALAGWD
jgi:hypothetical protein